MGRLSTRDTVLLILVLAAASAAGLWWFLVAPARADVAERDRDLTAITREVNQITDMVARLRDEEPDASRRTAERLRLAKALPVDDQVPAAIVQLEHLAGRSGVRFVAISAQGGASYGTLSGSEFEVRVRGRFHDVDDFLHRVHNQVRLDQNDRPVIGGRLLALRTVALTPVGAGGEGVEGGDAATEVRTTLDDRTEVVATLVVVAYSAGRDGAPDAGPSSLPGGGPPETTPPGTDPAAVPAEGAPADGAPAPTSPEPASAPVASVDTTDAQGARG
ncbi:MAG: type 4a pilus biogenesis protein PilO [Miltoncostaeaceae bacterium]